MSLLNMDSDISDVSNDKPGIDVYVNDMIEYLIDNKETFFKSQQRDEKDLTDEQKRNIAEEIFNHSKSMFLSRFGKQLKETHLKYFERFTDDENEGYDLNFYIQNLKRYFSFQKRKTDIKNRRYGALNKMIGDSSYFTEKEMMKRNPLLYEQLVGQYMSEDEKKKRDNIDTLNITFVNVLLEGIDRDEIRRKRKEQQRYEDGEIDVEVDTDEEVLETDRLKEQNRLMDEDRLREERRLKQLRLREDSIFRVENRFREDNVLQKEKRSRDEDRLRKERCENRLGDERELSDEELKDVSEGNLMDTSKDFSEEDLLRIEILKEHISRVNISRDNLKVNISTDNSKDNSTVNIPMDNSRVNIPTDNSRVNISKDNSRVDIPKAGTSKENVLKEDLRVVSKAGSSKETGDARKVQSSKINIHITDISKDLISKSDVSYKESTRDANLPERCDEFSETKETLGSEKSDDPVGNFDEPISQTIKWGEFEGSVEEPKLFRNWIRPRSVSPKEEVFITATERKLLKEEFVSLMYQSFIDGKDMEFDYSSVDNNEDYDDIEIKNYDAEEEYFDSESPEELPVEHHMDEDNGDNGVEMNGDKIDGDGRNGDGMDEESEDELDVYMRRLNQHHSIKYIS